MSAETDFLDSNAYVTAGDLVDGLCARESDHDRANRPLFLLLLKDVYQELNLSVIRQTERILLRVNMSQKYVDVPDGYLNFSSIGVANRNGKFEPLIINSNINTDIVDLGASKKCGCDDCECDCAYCSNVRNYELINSIIPAKMPDGSTSNFTATVRKKILKDGTYVREVTAPAEIYVNNVHTQTILQTKTETLCTLEVKECGCIKPTVQNESLIYTYCDSVSVSYDCGCPVRELPLDTKYYKINDKGNRIHFPADFPYETVLLRYYADRKTKNLRIPYIAQKAVRLGIKAEQTTFSEPGSRQNQSFIALYDKAKLDLATDMVKLSLSDFYKHVLGTFNVL